MSGYFGEVCGSVCDIFEINCFLSFFPPIAHCGAIRDRLVPNRKFGTKRNIYIQ